MIDQSIDQSIDQLLTTVRSELGVDVAFVSEFIDGRRVFRNVSAMAGKDVIAPGQSHALEDSFCQRVVDGRLATDTPDVAAARLGQCLPTYPFEIGCYIGVPVVLSNGKVHGTLCCFSADARTPLSASELRRVRFVAEAIGRIYDQDGHLADPRRSYAG